MNELEKKRDHLERRAQVEQSRLLRTIDALTHHRLVHGAINAVLPSKRKERKERKQHGATRWRLVLLGAVSGLAAFALALGIERLAQRRRSIS